MAMTTSQEKHTDLASSDTTAAELQTVKTQLHTLSMCFKY